MNNTLEKILKYIDVGPARQLLTFLVMGKPDFTVVEASLAQGKGKLSTVAVSLLLFLVASCAYVLTTSLGSYLLSNAWEVAMEDGIKYVFGPILTAFICITLIGIFVWLSAKIIRKWASLGEQALWILIGASLLASIMVVAQYAAIEAVRHVMMPITTYLFAASWVRVAILTLTSTTVLIAAVWLFANLCVRRIRPIVAANLNLQNSRKRQLWLMPAALYLLILAATLVTGDAITNVRGSPERQSKNWQVYNDVPVYGTLISCNDSHEKIACAITLWPDQPQNYSLFGDWKASVETGKRQNGNVDVLQTAVWKVANSGEAIVPVISLQPYSLHDIELWAVKEDACSLERASAQAKEATGIFFAVRGRLNLSRQEGRNVFRVVISNLNTLRADLRILCA